MLRRIFRNVADVTSRTVGSAWNGVKRVVRWVLSIIRRIYNFIKTKKEESWNHFSSKDTIVVLKKMVREIKKCATEEGWVVNEHNFEALKYHAVSRKTGFYKDVRSIWEAFIIIFRSSWIVFVPIVAFLVTEYSEDIKLFIDACFNVFDYGEIAVFVIFIALCIIEACGLKYTFFDHPFKVKERRKKLVDDAMKMMTYELYLQLEPTC